MLRPSLNVAIMVVTSLVTAEALLLLAGPQDRHSSPAVATAAVASVDTYALHTYDLDEQVVQLGDPDADHFARVQARLEVAECEPITVASVDATAACGPSPVGSPSDWVPVVGDAVIARAAMSTAAGLETQAEVEAFTSSVNRVVQQRLSTSTLRLELGITTLHLESGI